jgi:hypothetical protein
MPELGNQSALPWLLGLGLLLLGWFFVGNEIMRRRARKLALWCKHTIDPLGGKQTIRWLTQQAFRIEVEEPREPFQSAAITGLVESWDVPTIWLWNRLHGRRDIVLVQFSLRQLPIWGLELYRPGSLLAGDARRLGRREGWQERPLDEFILISGGEQGAPRRLACELLDALGAERARLVRLAVRRRGTHLALAMNVPDPSRFSAATFHSLLQHLAQVTLRFATPARQD